MPNDNDTLYTVLPLLKGSSFTVLQSLIKHFCWFCEHPGISKEALSSMLATHHSMLPPVNNLPSSYDDALKIIQPYLVKLIIVYDVCANNCMIFRGIYEDLSECLKCGSRRCIVNCKIVLCKYTYLPLKPRLVRLFNTSCMAQVLQSHAVYEQGLITKECITIYTN